MGKVAPIKKQIEDLDDASFAELRDWFIEYEHARWDRQIEADSAAGKLDWLIDEALGEHRRGLDRAMEEVARERVRH
jgi:hypothetical protein